MRYVIIRDDDTSAVTPVDCLERLYRPFLDRALPVNLAVIPNVATDTNTPDGKQEGFLSVGQAFQPAGSGGLPVARSNIGLESPLNPDQIGIEKPALQIGSNPRLVEYLLGNPGYHVVQPGC